MHSFIGYVFYIIAKVPYIPRVFSSVFGETKQKSFSPTLKTCRSVEKSKKIKEKMKKKRIGAFRELNSGPLAP